MVYVTRRTQKGRQVEPEYIPNATLRELIAERGTSWRTHAELCRRFETWAEQSPRDPELRINELIWAESISWLVNRGMFTSREADALKHLEAHEEYLQQCKTAKLTLLRALRDRREAATAAQTDDEVQ